MTLNVRERKKLKFYFYSTQIVWCVFSVCSIFVHFFFTFRFLCKDFLNHISSLLDFAFLSVKTIFCYKVNLLEICSNKTFRFFSWPIISFSVVNGRFIYQVLFCTNMYLSDSIQAFFFCFHTYSKKMCFFIYQLKKHVHNKFNAAKIIF